MNPVPVSPPALVISRRATLHKARATTMLAGIRAGGQLSWPSQALVQGAQWHMVKGEPACDPSADRCGAAQARGMLHGEVPSCFLLNCGRANHGSEHQRRGFYRQTHARPTMQRLYGHNAPHRSDRRARRAPAAAPRGTGAHPTPCWPSRWRPRPRNVIRQILPERRNARASTPAGAPA